MIHRIGGNRCLPRAWPGVVANHRQWHENGEAETKSIPSTCLHLSGFGLLGQLMANDIGRSYLEPSLWPILCRVPPHHNHRR